MRRGWLAIVLVVLGACGPAASPTPGGSPSTELPPETVASSPSGSASGTAVPSASATEEPATGLAVDSLAEVLVTDLVVRSHPGIDPPSAILADRLTAPDRAFVVDGPVEAAGYEWYLVAPLNRADGSRGPFGWIARASREGEEWVRGVAAPCPAAPVDLAGVLALAPLERLACFGNDPLTLTAPVITCGAGGGPWTFDPSWLLNVGGCGLALDTSGENVLVYREPPGLARPGPGVGPATVAGHFDDPSAASCTVTTADPVAYPAPSAEAAILMCRTEFVLEP